MVHIDIPVLKAIVDIHLPDLPGLVLTRSDVIDLEHAVTFETSSAQEATIRVGQMLVQWHEERVLRPERVKMRKAALARTKLRASSRPRALRPLEPAYRRFGGVRGIVTPQQRSRRSARGAMLPDGMAVQMELADLRRARRRLAEHDIVELRGV